MDGHPHHDEAAFRNAAAANENREREKEKRGTREGAPIGREETQGSTQGSTGRSNNNRSKDVDVLTRTRKQQLSQTRRECLHFIVSTGTICCTRAVRVTVATGDDDDEENMGLVGPLYRILESVGVYIIHMEMESKDVLLFVCRLSDPF